MTIVYTDESYDDSVETLKFTDLQDIEYAFYESGKVISYNQKKGESKILSREEIEDVENLIKSIYGWKRRQGKIIGEFQSSKIFKCEQGIQGYSRAKKGFQIRENNDKGRQWWVSN